MSEYHFKIVNGCIYARDNNGNFWNVIAKVINDRSCRTLLAMANFQENVEILMDNFLADTAKQPVLLASGLIKYPQTFPPQEDSDE